MSGGRVKILFWLGCEKFVDMSGVNITYRQGGVFGFSDIGAYQPIIIPTSTCVFYIIYLIQQHYNTSPSQSIKGSN
jgi:hypothetical protein